MTMPYFERDFWPNIIEDCICDVDKEDNERKRQGSFDDDDDDIFEGADISKKYRYANANLEPPKLSLLSKTSKKRSNRKSNMKSKKKCNTGTGDELFSVL